MKLLDVLGVDSVADAERKIKLMALRPLTEAEKYCARVKEEA